MFFLATKELNEDFYSKVQFNSNVPKGTKSCSYSYFYRLLHEEHSNKEAKQFSSYTGEPVDNGTSTQNS